MKRLRIYADTSVIGGCFDDEFREDSLRLWDEFRLGTKTLVLSDVTMAELEGAPPEAIERVALDDEGMHLADAYLGAGVVPGQSLSDAWHVALASVVQADVIVSWNFAHIVSLRRIREYHAVNLRLGYPMVENPLPAGGVTR